MVTEEGCGHVCSALSSNPSHLRELDLRYNHPGESGIKLLSDKLKDPNYKLQILRYNLQSFIYIIKYIFIMYSIIQFYYILYCSVYIFTVKVEYWLKELA